METEELYCSDGDEIACWVAWGHHDPEEFCSDLGWNWSVDPRPPANKVKRVYGCWVPSDSPEFEKQLHFQDIEADGLEPITILEFTDWLDSIPAGHAA